MRVKAKPSELKRTKWYEYGVRFFFGGLVTAIAGLLADKFGPAVGGLFLAFPAIFPASATLVEKHERQKKEQHGIKAEFRGRNAASADAAGAALGSIGLIAFGAVVWWLAPHSNVSAWIMLCAATIAWAAVSGIAWLVWKEPSSP